MTLLDPKEIRNQRSESADQASERIRKLAEEEASLIKRVNHAKEQAAKIIDSITKEATEFCQAKQNEKDILAQQVEKLREQKRELLKPIDEIKANAEKVLADAREYATELECKSEDIKQGHERNQEDAENNRDRAQLLDERAGKITEDEKAIDKEKSQLKLSQEKLKDDWAEYHLAVIANNQQAEKNIAELARLTTIETAINIRMKEQDARDIELSNKDKAVQDKFRELQKARDEILGRTT